MRRNTVTRMAVLLQTLLLTTGAAAQLPIGSPALHPRGSVHDTKEEARLVAGPDSAAAWLRVYTLAAPPDAIFDYFRWKLNAAVGPPVDSAGLAPGITSPVRFAIATHTFVDECLDPPASSPRAAGADTTCRAWRRGKDKRTVLGNALAGSAEGDWLESATFIWYQRDMGGALARLRVRVVDAGLAENWKRYRLATRVILDSTTIRSPAP